MKRIALVCPGRGTYTRAELGSLTGGGELRNGRRQLIEGADAYRESVGRATVTELDQAARFGALHLRGENAAALIYTGTAIDAQALQDDLEVVAVCGNSMGWYSALHVSGALDFAQGLRLADTMGGLQKEFGVIGGQLILPVVDDEWRPDLAAREAMDAACAEVVGAGHQVWSSIHLGGFEVLAGDDAGLKMLLELLPKSTLGKREYPFQLLGHSAFHTPLMGQSSERGQELLNDIDWSAPRLSVVDGRGHVFRPLGTDVAELRHATLQTQVTETYDFSVSLRVVLREFAPDSLVLLGPGETLGSAIAQVMISEGWRGIRSKSDFLAAQRSDTPPLISMGRAEQRVLVTRSRGSAQRSAES